MITPSDLARLSTLLDQAFALEDGRREFWLDELQGGDAALAPTLRRLLARRASGETADLLDALPAFTITDLSLNAAHLRAGDRVGPYVLMREIGHGGMGEVWLAERSDGQLKRAVALKLPMLGLRRSVLVQRFARERDILGSLTHPHIARLYDAGLTDDGQPYLALEYVEGLPITQYCAEQHLDTRARVALSLQVMEAVQYAHANLVIHRDLKPSNVLVDAEGQAMLLDFGIAKLLQDDQELAHATELTQIGGRALTLDYAAPEQLSGAPVSILTDVYALGVLLYELLAGTRPFVGARREIESAILLQEPARPKNIPSDLATIVLKALKKIPAERYATVNTFADDLNRWLRDEPVLAQPDSALYRSRKFIDRHRVGVAASMAITTMLVAVAISLWQTSIARREARTAEAVETFLRDVFSANSSDQADPEAARRVTARQLLDAGARRIDGALADSPEARLRVLKTLASMYEDLTLFDQALALHRKRVELVRQLDSSRSDRLAEVLVDMSNAAIQSGATSVADASIGEASTIRDGSGDQTSFERGRLESLRAYIAETQNRPDALKFARRSVEILRRYPPSPELLTSLSRQSFIASEAGEVDASIASIREALNSPRKAE